MNYRWMPELTLRMIFHMVNELGIQKSQRILDFGCAKGFIVKAFRIFDFEAYGVDISEYAIKNADSSVRDYCDLVNGVTDSKIFVRRYDWMISKDVFEHISEKDLMLLLEAAIAHVDTIFAVVPVAADDTINSYIIPEYNRDVTHIIIKSAEWWEKLFVSCGWTSVKVVNSFPGCKENWTSRWKNGNAFFILKST